MPIRAPDPFGAYVAGRQARQDEDYGNTRNALARMELEQAPAQMQRRNRLADLQLQSGEMGIAKEKAMEGYTRLRQALDSGNPREYVLQREPELAAKLRSAGVDLATVDDDTALRVLDGFAREYAGKAGVLPAAPAGPMSTQGKIGADVRGGYLTQEQADAAMAPRPDRFNETQAAMDRRAREQREFTAEQARIQREFAAEQARLKEEAKRKPGTNNPAANEQKLDSAMNTLSAIRDVKAEIGFNTAGPIGQALRNVGGTDAADMEANIDTIKANIGFDRLQMMRDASKTGGALGGIAVQELNLLQSTIASLNTKQGPKQLRRNLEKVEAQYTKAANAYRAAMGLPPLEDASSQQQAAPQPQGIDEAGYNSLPSGTQYRAPDGTIRTKR